MTDDVSTPFVKPITGTDLTGLCLLFIVILPVTPSKFFNLASAFAISFEFSAFSLAFATI